MSLEHIRVSAQAREQLIRLKRYTGIENWNVLCRWAFCVSLAESAPPPNTKVTSDSSVEMTWKVFGSRYADVYLAILKERCRRDGEPLDEQSLAHQFRLHLHRGIGYLAGDRQLRNITALTSRAPAHHNARAAT